MELSANVSRQTETEIKVGKRVFKLPYPLSVDFTGKNIAVSTRVIKGEHVVTNIKHKRDDYNFEENGDLGGPNCKEVNPSKRTGYKAPFEEVTINCQSADELLDHLDERNTDLWGEEPHQWIFRGQYDARWELIPSLYRGNWKEETTKEDIDMLSINMVDNFARWCSLNGLEIPNNQNGYMKRVEPITIKKITFDPSHIVFALAQHSGLPTHLLDFTYSPWIGAFFMYYCEPLLRHFLPPQQSDIMAKATFIENFLGMAERGWPTQMIIYGVSLHQLDNSNLVYLHHPFAEMTQLRSQQACFLYNTNQDIRYPHWSFENELLKLVKSKGVYRLTLPCEEMKELARLLNKKGINKSTVFPSYYTVADAVKREFQWTK